MASKGVETGWRGQRNLTLFMYKVHKGTICLWYLNYMRRVCYGGSLLKATTNFPTRSYIPVVVISFLCSPLQQNLSKDLLLFPDEFLSSSSLWNPLQSALVKVTSDVRFAKVRGKLSVLISPNLWTTSILFTTLSFSKSLLFLTLGLPSYVCSLLPCWMCSLSPFLVPPHLPVPMWACQGLGLQPFLSSVLPSAPCDLQIMALNSLHL